MAASLIRTSARTALRSGASAAPRAAASLTFARGKATLPDLSYDYGALEPSISGKIMELHHKNHHQTYVNSYNQAIEQLQEAQAKNDIASQIALKPLINFHGGAPSGALAKAIEETYGSLENFQGKMNTALAGIQGSGWAWLVRDKQTGHIGIKTYANQDPVVGQFQPLLGIDAWEHAYYLQYQNRKAEYFKAIWEVINWKSVEKRFSA
ncbi:superoxide dismutase sodB [Aspergillus novofumigatus IBT 16806]|uniref:Superoxide dismutase n=1 Tax=Aspergillus novofumigatus (strain IBT 16806) TaxID=1392255 RepID=A0A2I1C4R7_ASPN1|nr:putative Mn superoxide dismutase [Aspergillus novofumigatus IBT 16806]PKX92622.1 putative Mn superoxide dismutase [Aspergillus novofumigatus IBT 16806]